MQYSQLKDLEVDETPPFIYQLLLLSRKVIVLLALLDFIDWSFLVDRVINERSSAAYVTISTQSTRTIQVMPCQGKKRRFDAWWTLIDIDSLQGWKAQWCCIYHLQSSRIRYAGCTSRDNWILISVIQELGNEFVKHVRGDKKHLLETFPLACLLSAARIHRLEDPVSDALHTTSILFISTML